MNIFEFAARNKLRFPSNRGIINVEQLWDLPLQSRDGFDLDQVAKAVNVELKAQGEESFVTTAPSPNKLKLEAAMELVKYIIAAKLDLQEAARKRAARNAEREKLIAALADKEHEAIKGMDADAIKKRLVELDQEAV